MRQVLRHRSQLEATHAPSRGKETLQMQLLWVKVSPLKSGWIGNDPAYFFFTMYYVTPEICEVSIFQSKLNFGTKYDWPLSSSK